jgi:hypothetical protein
MDALKIHINQPINTILTPVSCITHVTLSDIPPVLWIAAPVRDLGADHCQVFSCLARSGVDSNCHIDLRSHQVIVRMLRWIGKKEMRCSREVEIER